MRVCVWLVGDGDNRWSHTPYGDTRYHRETDKAIDKALSLNSSTSYTVPGSDAVRTNLFHKGKGICVVHNETEYMDHFSTIATTIHR